MDKREIGIMGDFESAFETSRCYQSTVTVLLTKDDGQMHASAPNSHTVQQQNVSLRRNRKRMNSPLDVSPVDNVSESLRVRFFLKSAVHEQTK